MARVTSADQQDSVNLTRTGVVTRLPHETLNNTDHDLITHIGGTVSRDPRRDGSSRPQGGTNV
jgi:hypothetical protein